MSGDLSQGAKRSQVLGADWRGAGEPFADGGEDFDPLDGVNSQVRVHAHFHLQHLDRIAGLLAHHAKEGRCYRTGMCGVRSAENLRFSDFTDPGNSGGRQLVISDWGYCMQFN